MNYNSNQILKNKLRMWAVRNKITHKALKELLEILNTSTDIKSLPKDPRTLLETPKTVNVATFESNPSSLFWYQGVEKCLSKLLEKKMNESVTTIYLDFNMDGLPIYSSSKKGFGQFCV